MKKRPPRYAERILLCFLKPRDRKIILGDFEEIYCTIAEDQGYKKANFWYCIQIIKSIPGFLTRICFWSLIMFKNYLKITLRLIKRHRIYSFINITGLAIGIACCILSFLWVQDELSFDRFHRNHTTLYRVLHEKVMPEGVQTGARTPAGLAGYLKSAYPEVINTARFLIDANYGVKHNGKIFVSKKVGIVDPSFLELFSFPLLKGHKATALSKLSNIVITERMAQQLFGNEDPMGKVIDLGGTGDLKTVTGVLKDIPHNSHLQFDILLAIDWNRARIDDWKRNLFFTYIQLRKGTDDKSFSRRISGLVNNHVEESNTTLRLQPLARIYFHSNNITDTFIHGNIKYTYIFSFMAVLMLLIACINFMNLSTARSSTRAVEVGLRKVVGAKRRDIISQFLGESLFFASIGLLFALIFAQLSLPLFNRLAEKNVSLALSHNLPFAIGLGGIVLLTGFIAGSTPSLYLSRFQPAGVLRRAGHPARGGIRFRTILVIAQFSLTTGLLVGTLVIQKQLHFIHEKDLGFDKSSVVSMSSSELNRNFASLKAELIQNPAVEMVTFGPVPASPRIFPGISDVEWEGKDPDAAFSVTSVAVWYDYFKTFRIEVLRGRTFSEEHPTDKAKAFVINETAAKGMGLTDPIGKRFSINASRGALSGTIIGVVKDYHWASLHNAIKPLVFHLDEARWNPLLLRIRGGGTSRVISHLRDIWEEADIPYPFQFEFVDETIDNLYRGEHRIGTMFNLFTLIAVFISCLGLLGLTAFMAERRKKEMGIRKILGASLSKLVFLFSLDSIKWVLLANMIAWPVSFMAMNGWLNHFAYRTKWGLSVFLLAGASSLTIALLTVFFQALRLAYSNPVDTLRQE